MYVVKAILVEYQHSGHAQKVARPLEYRAPEFRRPQHEATYLWALEMRPAEDREQRVFQNYCASLA